MKRVAIWNGGVVPEALGGGSRENTVFNPIFDLGLLSEEVVEFYDWMSKDNVVEMFDAYCDMKFVYEGIEFKYGMIKYDYETVTNFETLATNTKAMDDISNYYDYHSSVAFRELYNLVEATISRCNALSERTHEKTQRVIDLCFDAVCAANEQKGTVKIKGKTAKGENWVNPAETIEAILIREGILSVI